MTTTSTPTTRVAADDSAADDTAFAVVPAGDADDRRLTHLDALEAEAILVIREMAGELERPALLFSGGKDSVVMLHLATKAFWPAPIPFPVLHVDTGHNFPEVLAYRDETVERLGLRLVVASVQDYIDDGRLRERADGTRNPLQTLPLLDAINDNRFDGVFGGGRRDEEKARAKERIVSLRDEFGQWDPKNQRPELWNLFNPRHRPGEHVRVFPISNWTEVDIWRYIDREDIPLAPLYYAHEREVFQRDGMWLAVGPVSRPRDDETVETRLVRYRTVGDMSCTGAVESPARTNAEIVVEVAASTLTERGATRADDRISEAAMEDRKKEGYF
ncbi:sulfate adenylyltransferase subunit CysD [Terracoccus sp. 273MFTsu3.1]|uniref:sulfate adenylyltransferase subunit CysD n=1 Tax=Terracoccus sp. 273MFTsu3.1 TaxID=1172188 RepID=UPI00035CF86F|nr:sulfate adenylyltransferase subunit CysD [Terracoccus sp. 273MFTsu3.1]